MEDLETQMIGKLLPHALSGFTKIDEAPFMLPISPLGTWTTETATQVSQHLNTNITSAVAMTPSPMMMEGEVQPGPGLAQVQKALMRQYARGTDTLMRHWPQALNFILPHRGMLDC